MENLFFDGENIPVTVKSDFIPEIDLKIGMVVILRKKLMPGKKYSFIVHRIIGVLYLKGYCYVLEKGDNDYFPKVCPSENIVGIVIGINDRPDFNMKLDPELWQKRNSTLLKFYKIVGGIYSFIEERNINKSFKKIWERGFLSIIYVICSLFNLKGR
ncbi:MAG: hypothetical protein ACMUJM_13300 [bacterium]